MGKVVSVLNRQINRFNVENRAHGVISKEKPTAAPRHPSTKRHIEKLLEETKDFKETMTLKDQELDENLKKVFVVSRNSPAFGKPSERDRLPTDRTLVEENELGYVEPTQVPPGLITLKQTLKILADHKEDNEMYNHIYISKEYKLAEEDALNLLKYFSSFKMHMPEKNLTIKGEEIKAILRSGAEEKKGLLKG